MRIELLAPLATICVLTAAVGSLRAALYAAAATAVILGLQARRSPLAAIIRFIVATVAVAYIASGLPQPVAVAAVLAAEAVLIYALHTELSRIQLK
ncbi:MAG: hypothetical protein DRJ57_04075 [Thermoprotei archaeon]|nr:MAG: hypothetical protein DRJ57_04075 [Thermoprotei archaeon]